MSLLANHSKPLRRPSLHEELASKIRELIVNGELEPGSKVPEKELCEVYGVSRTPLREALKVLASDGVITLNPNRGAWVTKITAADLKEVFPVMGALEALSGELACVRITEDEVDAIAELHARMVHHFEAGDRAQYFRVNQAIHEAILHAAENDTLTSHYRALAVRVRQARYVANMSAERWKQAIDEHEAMMIALRARDGATLARVLRAHLNHKAETVLAWLDGKPKDS